MFLSRLVSCRFASLDTNARSRGFLEAGACLVKFQQAVRYNCNLLFRVLAFIKILAEGKVGVGRKEEGDNMFLLAVLLGVPAQSNCGAGIQIKAGVWCSPSSWRDFGGTVGPGRVIGVTAEALAPPGVSQGHDAEQCPENIGEPAEMTLFSGFCAHCGCKHLSCLILSLQLERLFFFSRTVLATVDVSATPWTY